MAITVQIGKPTREVLMAFRRGNSNTCWLITRTPEDPILGLDPKLRLFDNPDSLLETMWSVGVNPEAMRVVESGLEYDGCTLTVSEAKDIAAFEAILSLSE